MKTLITGATGFIGTELVFLLLKERHEVCVLTRDPEHAKEHFREKLEGRGVPASRLETSLSLYSWNPMKEVAPATAFEGVEGVIHLAGENIGHGRWSEDKKKRIYESRRLGTRNLAETIRTLSDKPVFVSSSAVGYYGDRKEEILTEKSPPGKGFLAEVCQAWEGEAIRAEASRLVIFRNGVVLGAEGGVLEKMIPAFKAGVGGKLGSGKQFLSWIHHADMVDLYLRALKESNMSGVYNAVAPDVVRNEEFTHELAHLLHRPSLATVPAFALRWVLGEMADETLLASQRIAPTRLIKEGYSFHFPKLRQALAGILEESG